MQTTNSVNESKQVLKVKVIFLPCFFQVLYVLCLYEAQISGERLQDHWSSDFLGNLVIFWTDRSGEQCRHRSTGPLGAVLSEFSLFAFIIGIFCWHFSVLKHVCSNLRVKIFNKF